MLFVHCSLLTDPPSCVEADPPAPNAPTLPDPPLSEEEEEEPDCCRRSWAKTTAEKTITSVKANKTAKSLIFRLRWVFLSYESKERLKSRFTSWDKETAVPVPKKSVHL